MIQVKALKDGRRRAGRKFGQEWETFTDGYFSTSDLAALEADPMIAVREVKSAPEGAEVIRPDAGRKQYLKGQAEREAEKAEAARHPEAGLPIKGGQTAGLVKELAGAIKDGLGELVKEVKAGKK